MIIKFFKHFTFLYKIKKNPYGFFLTPFFSLIFSYFFKKKIKRGIIVINKKSGITSHDEVNNLRNILGIKKIGHSGTLDPKVTGVLVCGLGKGTKALEYILLSEKQYESTFEFHKPIDKKIFENVLKKFIGKINQLPPVKSAVKREERIREIYNLKILDYDRKKRWAKIICTVEKGTYIRKLAHDIGEDIGVKISMGDLNRLQAGVFSEKNSNVISSDDLKKLLQNFRGKIRKGIFRQLIAYYKLSKQIYPIEELFNRDKNFKKIFIKRKAKNYILSGNAVRTKNIEKGDFFEKDQLIAIFYKQKILAVGRALLDKDNYQDNEKEIIKIKKVLA